MFLRLLILGPWVRIPPGSPTKSIAYGAPLEIIDLNVRTVSAISLMRERLCPIKLAPPIDEFGVRHWAWWRPDDSKALGVWIHARGNGRGVNWRYVGPALTPDGQSVD